MTTSAGCRPSAPRVCRRKIALALGVSRTPVRAVLAGRTYRTPPAATLRRNLPVRDSHPRPSRAKTPTRRIHSRNGHAVRRLHFNDGWPADVIADALQLEPAAVADFLDRLTRRQHHKRRRESYLNRPRSRREQDALSEWDRLAVDDDGELLDVDVPELLSVEPHDLVEVIPATPPAIDEDWGSVHSGWLTTPGDRRRRGDD